MSSPPTKLVTTEGLLVLVAAAVDDLDAAASAAAASAFSAVSVRPSVHVVKYSPSAVPPVFLSA